MARSMSNEACIVSGTKNYEPYSKGLIRNIDSGLIVAEEIPSEADLKHLYEKEYFFGMEYSDYIADRPALEKNFLGRIKRLKKLGLLHSRNHVVEVGCAYGYFLNLLKNEVKSMKGYDVSQDGIKFAKEELGVDASNDDFLKVNFATKIDLVCMWDVIEHVSRPDVFVQKAADILKKGGALALTTGDIGTPVPKIRGGKWRMIHPPTHIYYFNKKSMYALLEKHGFEVVSYKYSATYRNVGSVLNQLIVNQKASGKKAGILRGFLGACERLKLTNLNVPLNTFDIMDVIAVKR